MPAGSRLKEPLDRLYREFDWTSRSGADAIQFPLRYRDPADLEIAGLLASCMAYGRVDLFGPWVEWILERMGSSPAAFVQGFDLGKERRRFRGFRYRFNREGDILAFFLASQRILARWGSLKGLFLSSYSTADPHVGPALEGFVSAFLEQDLSAVFPRNRLSYGYRHWFPRPSTGGACKRMHLFPRWMIRQEESDFALGHKRMSGQCLNRRAAVVCAPCALKPVCVHWRGRR